ncbi:anti-sigma factor family protein [Streptomyces sedi]|uniref:Zf-HC2 domain-containing protein n=1 Tax=Streptomyces sedi TaxID=555059 RepID=A0A5C4V557_9ACTN|nr:zf-HC2 domain-containing protein [Streptomyces sedi]TNM30199.1 zf-HC2 domain-containing protein [Streptomyces sedi]
MSERHPEPAELAAWDEDLLSPSEADVLREHLEHCASCATTRDELASLRQTLHDETDPGPIPDDVVFRIDAALAAEASRPREPSVVVSRETARKNRRFSRHSFALAAAGAALAVGIGGVLLGTLGKHTGDGSDTAAELGPGRDTSPLSSELPVEALEGQVRELLADSARPEPSEQQEPPTEDPLPEPDPPSEPPVPTGAVTEEPTEGAEEEPGEDEFHALSEIPSCVDEAIGRPEQPLAVNEEDYDGTDAYLVVFPHVEDPALVTAYVVDAQCVSSPSAVPGEILLEESYPRE